MDINAFLEAGAIYSSYGSSQVTISWGDKNESSDIDVYPFYYINNFYLDKKTSFVSYKNNITVDKKELCEALRLCPSKRQWASPNQIQFEDFFNKIKNSKFDKMVPIIYEKSIGSVSYDELSYFIASLLKLNNNGSIYGIWDNQKSTESCLLGFSPEVLFKVSSGGLETMALAGTAPLDSNISLLDDVKEVHEHQLVIEDIKKQLSNFANNIEVSKTQEIVLKHLKHLKTDIKAELENKEMSAPLLSSLVESMHPTAALGLFPRVKSWREEMKKIREPHAAEFYGAPFGLVTQNTAEFIVAIRNIQWDSGQLYIGSGCGIIDKSDCGKEWNELILKRNSVKKLIGI